MKMFYSTGRKPVFTVSLARFARRVGLIMAAGGLAVFDATAAEPPGPLVVAGQDTSYRLEIEHAIDRGLYWLQANQNSNGWWSVPDQPAVTALALMSFKGDPASHYAQNEPEWLGRGYSYLLGSVQPDGSIHREKLVTYNTSICMMALLAANKPAYDPVLAKARQFLVGLQGDFGEKGKIDSPFDGGVGYGSHYEHSDMPNTLHALEAIHYTRHLVADKGGPGAKDLNWAAAIHFLESCQNLPSHNHQDWVADDAKNRGGFVYYPGNSIAGSVTNPATGRVALRSYGSVSYAGLLSYIYADLKRDDPRVTAAYQWLKANYTLEENPGLGPQGLYYYYHTMAKALAAYGVSDLDLGAGRDINWRRDLSRKLLDLQSKDGSWANSNGRWWEKDPVLVTAYATLALETVYRGL
jgi:squalene-hopene/tetraprenyl-beta-curcumene cyclase